MQKLSLIFLISVFFFSPALNSQSKELTISDAVIGQYRQLSPSYLYNLSWRGELNQFTYIEDNNSLIEENVKNSSKKEILNIDDINTSMHSLGRDSLKRFPRIKWISDNVFTFTVDNQIFNFDLSKKIISEGLLLPDTGDNFIKNSVDEYAYNIGDNLYFLSKEGKSFQITNDGGSGIVYGKSVHRNEFGIENGIFWSPKGNLLAFYRMDQSMVTDYPLVDISTRIAEVKFEKYPMAGMTSHEVTVGVFDKSNQKVIYLNTGLPKDQYLTNITWTPDENYILIAILNREQNHMKLVKFDAKTGAMINTLFEERNEKYVEPEHPALFEENNNDMFIWQSERDGFNHLYLYNSDGSINRQLTSGNWEVTEVLGFDDNSKNLFIITTKDSPIERHLYSLEIKTGTVTKLTSLKGTHNPIINSKGSYFIDLLSSTEIPVQYDLISTKGKLIRTIHKSENPLKDYKMGEMKIFTIKADDGKTDLYCRTIMPVNFDSSKKYPAIVYVYGGPHAQLVTDTWLGGARMWEYYMAQKGYIMLTLDNRGSAHRGLKFENIIHRHVGTAEVNDQLKGIEYLKDLDCVDMERIGVHGWSYGGFMTTTLITKHPEIYKVAVAGGPVIDWKYYEVMYGERYMDTPEENPEGYAESSLIPQAENLEGKLLIIHGALDPTVVWQNSLVFIDECIKKNKQVDYFVYPSHEHNVRGYDRIHLMEKVTRYFDDYL